jgi:hypothetical protein
VDPGPDPAACAACGCPAAADAAGADADAEPDGRASGEADPLGTAAAGVAELAAPWNGLATADAVGGGETGTEVGGTVGAGAREGLGAGGLEGLGLVARTGWAARSEQPAAVRTIQRHARRHGT